KEAERAARCDFLFELADVGDGCVLTSENGRVVVDHHCYAIVVKREGSDFNVAGSFAIEDRFLHFEEVAEGILIFCTSVFKNFNKRLGTAVHDRTFGTVKLDQDIVDLESNQSGERMFDGAYPGSALFDGCSARHVHYVVAIGINYR